MNSGQLLAQILINGILFGGMYGIAAIGLSLIFGTMRIIFLAQGTMPSSSSPTSATGCLPYSESTRISPFCWSCPLPSWWGSPFFYSLFKEAAAEEDRNVSLLIAVGLMFLVENGMLKLWTMNPRSISTDYQTSMISFAGLNVSYVRLGSLFWRSWPLPPCSTSSNGRCWGRRCGRPRRTWRPPP